MSGSTSIQAGCSFPKHTTGMASDSRARSPGTVITSPPAYSSSAFSWSSSPSSSSSGSYPNIQTPQTPPNILGVLSSWVESSSIDSPEADLRGLSGQDVTHPKGVARTGTEDGHGRIDRHERRFSDLSMTFSVGDGHAEELDAVEEVVSGGSSPIRPNEGSHVELTSPTIHDAALPDLVVSRPVSSSAVQIQSEKNDANDPHTDADAEPSRRSLRHNLQASVRRKLERSKSSFNGVLKGGQGSSLAANLTPSESTSSAHNDTSEERPRLRTLLSFPTRSAITRPRLPTSEVTPTTSEHRPTGHIHQSISLRESYDTTSQGDRSALMQVTAVSSSRPPEGTITVADSSLTPSFRIDKGKSRAFSLASMDHTHDQHHHHGRESIGRQVELDLADDLIRKGIARSESFRNDMGNRKLEIDGPTASSSSSKPISAQVEGLVSSNGRMRLDNKRAMSVPVLPTGFSPSILAEIQAGQTSNTGTIINGSRPGASDGAQTSLFETMLPREIKLRIMKTLLAVWDASPRTKRWDGEVGGQRNLIKLSQVSKSWQTLCFDGQLWPTMHLTPIAKHIHPNTFRKLCSRTYPFISSLSLKGLNALGGSGFFSALIAEEDGSSHTDGSSISLSTVTSPQLSMLRDLNLRGCRLLPEDDLIKIIEHSPSLQRINLQGVQAVSPKVLSTIAEHTKNLQELNVSRSPLSIPDICDFIRLMSDDQAWRLKSLKIAGLKSPGPERAETDLFPLIAERLVNLESLDILGCTHIDDKDLAIFRTTHHTLGTTSPLRHLIMSNCTRLTSKSLASLAGLLPNMTKLELAGMPRMFTEDAQDGWNDKGFLDLLRSMPKLRKLDLEGTGIRGGVTDRMLDVLTPMRLPPTAGRRSVDNDAASAGQSRYAPGVGCELVELRIGYATRVTPEGLLRFIRGSPMLRVLEADNTSANDAVMRAFCRRHSQSPSQHPDGPPSLSLVDCAGVTSSWYSQFAPTTRPRDGWIDYASIPMGYTPIELPLPLGAPVDQGYVDVEGAEIRHPLRTDTVLKTFWSWKRVGVAKPWKQMLREADLAATGRAPGAVGGNVSMNAKKRSREDNKRRGEDLEDGSRRYAGSRGSRRSWWKAGEDNDDGDDDGDDRAGCVVQ